jgi:ribonuclease HI
MDTLEFYTDGACSQNSTWKGGWAVIKVYDNKEVGGYSGHESDTTNNRMELTAFLYALKDINENKYQGIIYTDSAYISNCFKDRWYVNWKKNGWLNAKKEPVANRDLWSDIIYLYEKNIDLIRIEKVKGHSNNVFNNRADQVARMEAQ